MDDQIGSSALLVAAYLMWPILMVGMFVLTRYKNINASIIPVIKGQCISLNYCREVK